MFRHGDPMVSLLPTYHEIDIGGLVLLAYIVAAMVWRIRSGALGFPSFRGKATDTTMAENAQKRGLLGSLTSLLLLDVGISKPLQTCNRTKWSSHILIFWGFVFDGIATILAFFMKPEGAVLPLDHPVKIFGNTGGVLLVVGCSMMFYARFQESGSIWDLHRSDYFMISLLLTAITGFLIENTIYLAGRAALITPYIYWTHIVVIASLFVTAPWTKFTHAFYKPSWILYQKVTGQQEETPAPHGLGGPALSGAILAADSEKTRRND
jgi:nitrate reductase gamma subunit